MRKWRSAAGGSGRIRGSSMVEFAFVAALLIFLLLGIMEMGFMMSNTLTLSNAAFEGARVASMGRSVQDVQDAINRATSSLNPEYLSAPIFEAKRFGPGYNWQAWVPGTTRPGGNNSQIRVTLSYNYHYITGSALGALSRSAQPDQRVIRRQAVVR
jgi:Flp pilus assembly protein TadG